MSGDIRPPMPPRRRCIVSVDGVQCERSPRYPGRDESSFCATHDNPANAETRAWQHRPDPHATPEEQGLTPGGAARVGYVPASLSPEWHAELALVEAESRNATLDEVVRAVEALPPAWATDEHYRVVHGVTRDAVLDAVMALRS